MWIVTSIDGKKCWVIVRKEKAEEMMDDPNYNVRYERADKY